MSNKVCNWCRRHGHTAQGCKSKQQRERFLGSQKERGNAATKEEDYIEETDKYYQSDNENVAKVGFVAKEVKDETSMACVIDGVIYPSFTEDTMFGDSGCSCRIRNTMEDMFDTENINEQIGGVGNNMRTTRKGKLKTEVVQADGSKSTRILSPVKHSKDAKETLLSLAAEMTAGAKLSSATNNDTQLVSLDGDTVTFDRHIKTRDGWVSGVDIVPIPGKQAKEEKAFVVAKITSDVNEYHRQLGHPNEQVTRTTAKAFGIKLTGKFQKYEDCAIAKAHKKNVKKIPSKKAKHSGGCISLDISSPGYKGMSGKRHWLLFFGRALGYVFEPLPKTEKRAPRIFSGFYKGIAE